ncbi:C-type lectin domain family 5 member A isoform X3 [Peromyscus leucopus]|uniref:C-type lectin domain family 5 member A isoform X3 n=1 Tax=Peromyscus leucopus TaxID=10041 RepID=UPI001885A3A1|nr:C-type lectin domain family 5 member A isoform X3 [Peromyscus leucopus]
MNWNMIISVLIIVVIKVVGMTLFLLYFPQVFDKSNDGFIPTESYGTTNVQNVSQIFGENNESVMPTRNYETVSPICPKDWDFHQGRCFFFSTSESSWENSRDDCASKESTLAIVNTPEILIFRTRGQAVCVWPSYPGDLPSDKFQNFSRINGKCAGDTHCLIPGGPS